MLDLKEKDSHVMFQLSNSSTMKPYRTNPPILTDPCNREKT